MVAGIGGESFVYSWRKVNESERSVGCSKKNQKSNVFGLPSLSNFQLHFLLKIMVNDCSLDLYT